MNHISVRNVNEALIEGLWQLRAMGVMEDSRNGPVVVMPGPFCTTYAQSKERVLFCPLRDANPVFHLMESIWMLAGSRNVDWLLPFNRTFAKYAEENGNIHGAYGYRWREHFSMDQLHGIVDELILNPNSRRAVLSMWDPEVDLGADLKDIPCNTHIYFDLRGGYLNMTVCCRSNDAIMGAYGANVVHFSILQEVLAHAVGAPVGVYRQLSNNFHLYTEEPKSAALWEDRKGSSETDFYLTGDVKPFPLLSQNEHWTDFLDDSEILVSGKGRPTTTFFKSVAAPLRDVYLRRQNGDGDWQNDLLDIVESDWKLAFQQWTNRRELVKGVQA